MTQKNRAIATIRRLEREQTKVSVLKFRNTKRKIKPQKIVNGTSLHVCIPIVWYNMLKEEANKKTEGNVSEVVRQILGKSLNVNKTIWEKNESEGEDSS